MTHVIADRVRETSTSVGLGAFTLGGASIGFRAYGDVLANGDTAWYTIAHRGSGEWEVGIGTWATGGSLTRTSVLSSSNGGALVSFSAGTKDVFLSPPASEFPRLAPKVTVLNAQVVDLLGNRVTVVPGESGQILIPTFLHMRKEAGGYTIGSAGRFGLYWSAGPTFELSILNQANFSDVAGAETGLGRGPGGTTSYVHIGPLSGAVGAGLQLGIANANLSGPGGPIDVVVKYERIPLVMP